MSAQERVLIVAHGHPSSSKGGAEIVAKTLFDEYRRLGLDATLLARSELPAHGGSVFSRCGSDRELLFHTQMDDYFNFRCAEPRHVWTDFRDLLIRLRPSVVHFHHYLHLGLELIHEVRRTLPDARIVLTLHEYLLLCHHNGQMVKTGTLELCYRATPDACASCFPERSAGDFFLRERYIKSILEDVDLFIAPSRFLADRYVGWGIEPERISVIENGQVDPRVLPPRSLAEGETRGRFGYFGRINNYKGTLLLLEAFRRLAPLERERVHLDIYGAGLSTQHEHFQELFETALGAVKDCAEYHGPYEPAQLPNLMSEVDWVVVPSMWWENSPLVIQEALCHGRPVICSDIGGMAEKVRDGADGYHFQAGNAGSLREVISRVSSDEKSFDQLLQRMRTPPDIRETARRQLELYREI